MTGLQLHQFHNDLSNIIKAGVPLQIFDDDRRRSVQQSLQGLESQQKLAEQQLDRLAELRSLEGLSPRYLAALQIYDLTGNLFIVLDGLTRRHAAISEIKKVLRWPLFYLMFVITLAVAGWFFFQWYFVPVVNEFRQDLRMDREYVAGPMSYYSFRAIASGLIFGGAIGFLLFGIFKFFNYLAMTMGGRQFVESSLAAQAGKTIEVLLSHGVDNERSVELACNLVGLPPVGRDNNPVTAHVGRDNNPVHAHVERDNNPVLKPDGRDCYPVLPPNPLLPPNTPSAFTDSNPVHDWISWTQLWSNHAQRQINKLRFAFPSILILVVGGIVVLGYGFLIYGTVMLIYDDILGEFR